MRVRLGWLLGSVSPVADGSNPEEFLKVLVLPYAQALRALTFENDKMTLRAAEKHLRLRDRKQGKDTADGKG